MTVAIDLAPHLPDHAPFVAVCDGEDRERWLRARRGYICASETAGVLGCSPWTSQLAIWADKTGRVPHEVDENAEWIFWGSMLEPAIIKGYALRTARAAVPFGILIRSQRFPWLAATPDALCTDNLEARANARGLKRAIGLLRKALREDAPTEPHIAAVWKLSEGWWPLQTKNIGYSSAEHWTEGVPLYYTVQCTQEALVFGANRTTGAALIAGQRLAWDDVALERGGILTRQIVNLTEAFWRDRVLADVEPPTDASDSARRALDALYPRHVERVVTYGHEALDIAEQLDLLKAAEKKAKKDQALYDNQIRQLMQDAERMVLPDGSGFTLKTNTNGARVLLRKKAKE